MSSSNDWLGIEDEPSKESPQNSMEYMALLRQQQQQQALAYRQEMLKRQQQLQQQARNIGDVVNYPLIQQQQLLQRHITPSQPQLPQSQSYHQARLQQMQLIQQQLMQQKALNQGLLSRSIPPLANMTQAMIPGSVSPNMQNSISSPAVQSYNLGSNIPLGNVDGWTKGYLNFMKNIGKELKMLPNINGQLLDLKSFTQYVVDLGGFDKVMSENKWPQVAVRLGLESDASEKVAYLYKTLLLDFERRVYPGLSLLAQSEMRKKMVNIPVKKPTTNVQTEIINQVQNMAGHQSTEGQSPRFIDSPLQAYGSPAPEAFTDSTELPTTASSRKESDPTIYMPKVRKISSYGGYDNAIFEMANTYQKRTISSLGIFIFLNQGDIDLYRVKMSLKSQLDSDCQYAIDSILSISAQQRTAFTLERYSDMVDAMFDLLSGCLQEAFGKCMTRNVAPNLRDKMTYCHLYDLEIELLEEFRKDTESSFQTPKLMLAERILAISTAIRNFSFDSANALFLSKHVSFWPVIHSILLICLHNDPSSYSPLTLQEAGVLDHRKNLVIIFSHIGSQITIPSESSQLVLNLLEDFLSVQESIYSYAALEALAKLSLVEENHKFFVSTPNLKALITSSARFLPLDGFLLNSPQDVTAQWELASLFIYNISAMDDDQGRLIIMELLHVMKSIIRIASAGIKIGNDIHADYIGIITLRMLKCMKEISSNHECRSSLLVFEKHILRMMMDSKAIPYASPEFKAQVGIITSRILKNLEEKY